MSFRPSHTKIVPHILAVGGMAAEARIAAAAGWTAVVAGGRPDLLRARLAEMAGDYGAVLSFGIAGGLDPALAPGTIVVARGVVAADGRFDCDPTLIAAIDERLADIPSVRPRPAWISAFAGMSGRRRGARVIVADIAGAAEPVLGAADKRALFAATGAATVDLESHVAAAYARARNLPFAAVRVLCDPAGRSLPALTARALKPDGTTDLTTVLRGLAKNPAALSALVRLAADSHQALTALSRAGFLLGAGLGLDL